MSYEPTDHGKSFPIRPVHPLDVQIVGSRSDFSKGKMSGGSAPNMAVVTSPLFDGLPSPTNLRPLCDKLIDMMRARNLLPHEMDKFLNTVWENKGGYPPPKDIARVLASMLVNAMNAEAATKIRPGGVITDIKLGFNVADSMLHHNIPFRFVDRDLLEALLKTRPPNEKWDFETNPLPLPAMCFVLPDGGLPSDEEGCPIELLFFCKKPFDLVASSANYTGPISEERFIVMAHCLTKDRAWWSTFPVSQMPAFGDDHVHRDIFMSADAAKEFSTPDHRVTDEMRLEAALATHRLLTICFNLCAVMNARPALLTGGETTRIIKDKHGIHKPIRRIPMLGDAYRRRTSAHQHNPSLPTGRHNKAHWRIGHWHHVRFGKGRSQIRLDWFEPVFVGLGA